MNEVWGMWKKPKMVFLVLVSAGLYAAFLIPFKGFVLIPGITEFRVANALPVVLGLLFGPAGAWGSAIGNLAGDFFGSLSVGSIFGFAGNFMFAYVPYKLWINAGFVSYNDDEPNLKSRRKIAAFTAVAILGSAACALPIAWGLELVGLVPFAAIGSIVLLNNSLPSVFLGLPILAILYPKIKKWGFLWTDILDRKDVPVKGRMSGIGAFFMITSIAGGLAGGFAAAFRAGQSLLYKGFEAGGQVGSLAVVLVAGAGTAGLFLSSFIQTMPGREEHVTYEK
ncbi:QueT transporter family protein [Aminivibrio sp.]|uniref:QueT transporter family protein n=1 Tax=Aminivibrio sp. TaxID=1872489 RepID=UPI00345EC1C9